MNRIKRKKPLLSIEQICEMNGVKYDTSHPSDYVEIINDDGESLRIDSSFNLFSNNYNVYVLCSNITSELFNGTVDDKNYKDQLTYKNCLKSSNKLNCSYKSYSPLFSNDLCKLTININIAA